MLLQDQDSVDKWTEKYTLTAWTLENLRSTLAEYCQGLEQQHKHLMIVTYPYMSSFFTRNLAYLDLAIVVISSEKRKFLIYNYQGTVSVVEFTKLCWPAV